MAVASESLKTASHLWHERLSRLKAENKPTTSLRFTILSPLYYAWCLVLTGHEEEGLALAETTLFEAQEMGAYCHVRPLTYLATIFELTGDYKKLKATSQNIIELAQKFVRAGWPLRIAA